MSLQNPAFKYVPSFATKIMDRFRAMGWTPPSERETEPVAVFPMPAPAITAPAGPAWHKGPPPHVGWWNASTNRSTHSWRWWDGVKWSTAADEWDNAIEAAGFAALPAETVLNIEWTDYWPADARVPRVDPRG